MATGAEPKTDFDRDIAPLFAERCLDCHSGPEPQGGLDLSRRDAAAKGGESGPAFTPSRPDDSLLLARIRAGEMPPKEKDRLSEVETRLVESWIAEGAKWGTDPIDPFRLTTARRAGYDWWALQPVHRPMVPLSNGEVWPRTPVDAFILSKLTAAEITPSAEAEPRLLVRRLYLDLLGLPPTPDEVAAYLDDDSPAAYERLVDRLLASPRYGERWARHWLDVVRFGESQGFERDKLRPNSWRYRDWVVAAFNEDLPYDEFVRLQLAGDVLMPDDPAAVTATGFLVAGAYDEVGQTQQSLAMRAVVRQDELEDIVGVVGQTFLGLTVNCARCHDHKFDPIRQKEYYQLTAALAGVRHGERKIDDPLAKAEQDRMAPRRRVLQAQLAELEGRVREQILAERKKQEEEPRDGVPARATEAAPRPIARWEFDGDLRDSLGELHGIAHCSAIVEEGALVLNGQSAYVSTAPLDKEIKSKTLEAWVSLANLSQRGGAAISLQTTDGNVFDAIVFGEREPGRWMAGSDGFGRTQSFKGEGETEADAKFVHVAITYAADGTITGYRNGLPYGAPYQSGGPATFAAGKSQLLFGLRHGTAAAADRLLAGKIERAQLYDRALTADEVAASAGRTDIVTGEQIAARLTPDETTRRQAWQNELQQIEQRLTPTGDVQVYAVTPQPPEATNVLLRGNPASKGEIVSPAGIESLRGVSAGFGLSPDAADADRRRQLAAWITERKNPLFARVLVNRLWQYHFGVGLVDTPNDFGFSGGRPSHPELLDWLSAEFISSGHGIKNMQRLIVTSAAYRQASQHRPEAAAIDAGNRLLWRKSPLRLEAETLRDAVLLAADELNPAIGGPPFADFRTFTSNTQFYEMFDPVGHEFQRRTLYRTWVRSGRSALLDVFDCPDPSTTAPRRAMTTTPLQALSLFNNSFVLRMADALAARLARERPGDVAAQVQAAWLLVYCRPAADDESALAQSFISQHGLPALCRVLLNSNEFLHAE